MIFIDNEGCTDPKLNLALEEYALRNFDASTDYLLFYINKPSIIIGRNQNTLEEINQEYIYANNIEVVRRISGGGAVYHDLGNLNFSFITNHDGKSISNFKKFTAPVIRVLNNMGVTAELKGRNDILVDEKKISGTAQFSTGKRMISHGTLLFDTDMGEVSKALQVKMSKIQSKGHKSVRSRVANISEFLKTLITMDDFKQQLLNGLFEAREHFEIYKYTKEKGLDFVETLCGVGCTSMFRYFEPDRLKVASRDLTNLPLLNVLAETKIPIILSTGMGGPKELDDALEVITKHHDDVSILHCLSQYPSDYKNINLLTIPYLKKRYPQYTVGYSDHSIGIVIPVAAVTLGAEIIEKHITLDRNLKGTDQKGSLAIEGIYRMVRDIRNLDVSLGEEKIEIVNSVESFLYFSPSVY